MRKTRIRVTKKDIIKGRQKSFSSCPVALAMERALGLKVKVGTFYAEVPWYGKVFFTRKTQKFIHNFDSKYKGNPFSFYI